MWSPRVIFLLRVGDGGTGKLTWWQRWPKTKKTWRWWRNFLAAHTSSCISLNQLLSCNSTNYNLPIDIWWEDPRREDHFCDYLTRFEPLARGVVLYRRKWMVRASCTRLWANFISTCVRHMGCTPRIIWKIMKFRVSSSYLLGGNFRGVRFCGFSGSLAYNRWFRSWRSKFIFQLQDG